MRPLAQDTLIEVRSTYLKKWNAAADKNFAFPVEQSNFNVEKNITATGIAQHVGQVKYVGQLLENLSNAELNETAVILGGGFTAADCLGNLNRQGVNDVVHQFELIDMIPRPTPVHKEVNPDCRSNILTEKVIDNGKGQVAALQATNVRWVLDDSGYKTFEKERGSEFTVETDMVFLALGYLGPEIEGLLEKLHTFKLSHELNRLF